MKRIAIFLLTSVVIMGTMSCKKYLDVNQNPNSATSSTPDLVFPQSLVYMANMVSSFNNYGAQVAGVMANAGGYGGFNETWTYLYTTGTQSGLWSSTYDMLEDYDYVINSTKGVADYANYNAAARVMQAYGFELLVDQYNDIPYTEALKGAAAIGPKYDKATDIYPALANQLDSAIAIINANPLALALTSASDPLFGGDMTKWKQFANTIKLRLIIHAGSKATFANKTFSSDGFLTTDAVINPGYGKINGQQNPTWNTWVSHYDNGAGNRAYNPAKFMFGYFDGHKLTDGARGRAIYYNFPNTPTNQMGYQDVSVPNAPAVSGAWYSTITPPPTTAAGLGNNIGIMKGYNMGLPIMLAAESYFLQAEANMLGIVSGDPKTSFVNGMKASFAYLYKLPDGSTKAGYSAADSVNAYIADNITSPLVNFDLATTNAQKLEAIITQKYIALNFINSHESWNEYRRTKFPVSTGVTTGNAYGSMASTQSASTRPDKLPTRLQYPTSEYTYNPNNVPTNINSFGSLIFWAQ